MLLVFEGELAVKLHTKDVEVGTISDRNQVTMTMTKGLVGTRPSHHVEGSQSCIYY